jgi:3-isopropylmalate/(R)-2-methylmalate dehydratase small subunit
MSLQPFIRHEGVVAPLLRDNVDTDAIIPSREMKRVSRTGLADGLFAGWRYLPGQARAPDPAFVLNDPRYSGASILVTGRNFGCGSSREHAVWALAEYGIRVILAPSFASIFERNCVNNGVLPIVLDRAEIQRLLAQTEVAPQPRRLGVDLRNQALQLPNGETHIFRVSPDQRTMLLNGWDPVEQTLQLAGEIDAFEQADRSTRPWAYDLGHGG